nr:plasmid stabilization protein [Streptomyces sp. BA2]
MERGAAREPAPVWKEYVVPQGSSKKRERQYEHIKEGAEKRGTSEGRAKEIAARTVNKERARSGESKTASKTSTRDKKSASQRGGERSHSGSQGPTKDQLYAEAKKRGIDGRSSMNKQQLAKAVGR